MSDVEDNPPEEKPFAADIAKQGRAVCKKCKQKCLQGELRLAKLIYNPFGTGKMKAWHHMNCLFESFLKQRQTTKRLESPDEIEGWDSLCEDDQNMILDKIKDCDDFFHKKFGTKPNPPKKQSKAGTLKESPGKDKTSKNKDTSNNTNLNSDKLPDKISKDQYFKQFRRLVADITNNSSYLDKTSCVKKLFTEGSDGNGFKDDIVLWCKLLLPGVVKRVYNLQSKQLIKLFSRLFVADQNEMLEHLEQGDVGETIQKFFEESLKVKPAKKATLTVQEVDQFLKKLCKLTKEDDQQEHFKSFIPKCTSNDLKTVIRLIKGDLRMGAGAKHILEGVHPDAYEAYQASRDLDSVITKCLHKPSDTSNSKKIKKNGNAEISVMTPVLPMLAEACKSVEQAMKKCPNGMYSEIKYDGERVQVHKHGSEFKYFSRSLKPVMPHKIQHFKDFIPKAFPHAKDLILDSEILMIDTQTGKPLPFGTLGVHKKAEFKDANVCLFVFDCIFYNGENLSNKPLIYRKKVLHENMIEIENHIVFSEKQEIHQPEDLSRMIAKVLQLGLEGLVLKDLKSIYEPGKRHWLKVKKDYLFGGAMADSADLIVLGAWYGTGKKGGMMSVFLMGCLNPKTGRFCTVTKVHTGHDDKTLEKLQKELDMVKIGQDMAKVPSWLLCTKTMVPDFVARDPKNQPIWEITGAEFTQHDVHTADGISIRFPRVTKIRNDKNWETATSLPELQKLYKLSKEHTDVSLLLKDVNTSKEEDTLPKKRSSEFNSSGETPPKKKKHDFNVLDSKTTPMTNERGHDNGTTPMKNEELKNQDDIDMKDASCLVTNKIGNTVDIEMKSEKKMSALFHGIKVLLEDKLRKQKHVDIARLIQDNGGEILTDDEWRNATHALHYNNVIRKPDLRSPHSTKHLAYKWVKDSVEEGVLKDFRKYTVHWDPDS